MVKERNDEVIEDIDALDITVKEEGEFELITDEEWLPAIVNIIKGKRMKFGVSLNWEFLLQDDLEGRKVWGLTGTIASLPTDQRPRGSKLYDWYTRIIGRELKADEKLDLKSLFGRKVEVFIENKKSKSGERTFQNVTKVRSVEEEAEGVEMEEGVEEEEVQKKKPKTKKKSKRTKKTKKSKKKKTKTKKGKYKYVYKKKEKKASTAVKEKPGTDDGIDGLGDLNIDELSKSDLNF